MESPFLVVCIVPITVQHIHLPPHQHDHHQPARCQHSKRNGLPITKDTATLCSVWSGSHLRAFPRGPGQSAPRVSERTLCPGGRRNTQLRVPQPDNNSIPKTCKRSCQPRSKISAWELQGGQVSHRLLAMGSSRRMERSGNAHTACCVRISRALKSRI